MTYETRIRPGHPINPTDFGIPEKYREMAESYARWRACQEREECAITAWSSGMDAHNASRGLPCDARDVGSKAAAAIRARGQS